MNKKHCDRRRSFEHLLLAALMAVTVASPLAALESSARASDRPRRQAVITVKGMQCPFCAYGIKKHLAKVSGVEKVEVELAKNQATVYVAPDANVTDAQLQRAVRKAGFEPSKIEWR